MAGTDIEQYEGRGINYRALDDLFALNAKRQGEVSCMHHRDWHMLKPATRMLFASYLAVANLELMSILLTCADWTSCLLRHSLLASSCSNPCKFPQSIGLQRHRMLLHITATDHQWHCKHVYNVGASID